MKPVSNFLSNNAKSVGNWFGDRWNDVKSFFGGGHDRPAVPQYQLNGAMPNVSGMSTANYMSGGGNWYGPAGQANWFFGAGAAFSSVKGALNAEKMYSEGIRRGLAGNYALTGRNLSLFGKMTPTKASMPISSLAKWGGIAGKVSLGIGVALDVRGMLIYKDNPTSPDAVHPAKAGINTAMGAYGLTWAGSIPSLLYFGVDAFYPTNQNGHSGWQGYAEDQDALNEENSFNPYWQLWPKSMKL